MDFSYCKLEIFISEMQLEALQRALQETDAGHIGNYAVLPVCLGDMLFNAFNEYLGFLT